MLKQDAIEKYQVYLKQEKISRKKYRIIKPP